MALAHCNAQQRLQWLINGMLMLQARKGESDSTPDDILAMVKAQAQPPHRCVESCLL